MKQEWKELRKKIDNLERTDRLDWKKLSNRELKIIQANLFRGDRKHWSEPATNELNSRRNFWLVIISGSTLFFAIIGVILGILQYYKN